MNRLFQGKPLPLSEREKFFKQMYQAHPEAHLDQEKTLKEIAHLLPEAADQMKKDSELLFRPADSLTETRFPSALDVALYYHARYAPAFLHSHSFFEVIYVLNGNCKNIFASQMIEMCAGEIFIVTPGTVHALSAFSDDCAIINLMVRGSTFEKTFLQALPQTGFLHSFFHHALYHPDTDTSLYFKSKPDSLLTELVRQMWQEFHSQKNYYDSMLNALLTTFFIQLLRNHEKTVVINNQNEKYQDENIIYILKYLEMHWDTLTLGDLAAFFNYSERQMSRILKNCTGQTFTALQQQAKLSHACELLKHPNISIRSIAEKIGYSNITYFYNLFQKQFHISPAEYRKQFAADEMTTPL